MKNKIFPVYILSQMAQEIFRLCQKAVPNETMGKLYGYRCHWEGENYIKVVDWSMGTIESSHTHAQFTLRGTRECELFLDERYGKKNCERPTEIGIFHSHPFNTDPHFSSVDYGTFLSFPYNREGNVFILIDPLAYYFKTYQIQSQDLQQVTWIMYHPKIK